MPSATPIKRSVRPAICRLSPACIVSIRSLPQAVETVMPAISTPTPEMGDRIAPGTARQMAQPAEHGGGRQFGDADAVGEIDRHTERRPDGKRQTTKRAEGCAGVEIGH